MNKLDHVNVVMRNAETKSLITQTAGEISLRVDAIDKSYAELKVTSDAITSHVEDISDTANKTFSEIQQTSTKIRAVVVQNNDSGEWELSKDAFVVAFNGSTNRKAIIDRSEGLYLGDVDSGTYSKIGYDGRLSLLTNGSTKPYHCLNYSHVYTGLYSNDADEEPAEYSFALPSMFSGINDEDISITASVAKANDSNSGDECVAYWFGAEGYIRGGRIILYVTSTWRDYHYDDTNSWITGFDSARAGYLSVQVNITA